MFLPCKAIPSVPFMGCSDALLWCAHRCINSISFDPLTLEVRFFFILQVRSTFQLRDENPFPRADGRLKCRFRKVKACTFLINKCIFCRFLPPFFFKNDFFLDQISLCHPGCLIRCKWTVSFIIPSHFLCDFPHGYPCLIFTKDHDCLLCHAHKMQV